MSLSIAWVTPFSKHSDVSAFSRNILIALSSAMEETGGSLTLFINPNGADYWTPLPAVHLTGTAQDREILAGFDVVIFNIGNNSRNHRHINWLALQVPGVVIVHDMVMQHFFAEEIFENFRRRDFYARLICAYYGEAGLATVGHSRICSENGDAIYAPWDSLHASSMPLLEPFVETAAAVVVHSAYAERFVAPRLQGPVLRLALPWDQKLSLDDDDLRSWAEATARRAVCNIVCFGYIGQAKCLDSVIAAFVQSELLRQCARLIIAGYPGDTHYTDGLVAMVAAHGLGGVVEFEFSVSDQRLLTLKQQADVFVNLRYPNTESASGSMVEQMNAGKPVLVYPSGCYAEIDPDAAIFVQRSDGVPGLVQALESIIADPEARVRIGSRGRDYVRRIGRKEYVARLLAFLEDQRGMLRERKRFAVGQRNLPRTIAEDGWLERLSATRDLFSDLRRSQFELSLAPFLSLDHHALILYVTVGLFGQAAGSALQTCCGNLLSRYQRPDFYRLVGFARIIWNFCRLDPSTHVAEFARLLSLPPILCPESLLLLRACGDDHFSRALYVAFLGRLPAPHEVDAYVRRLQQDKAQTIIREFLFSEEFLQRRAPRAEIERLLQWCDQDHYFAVDRPLLELESPVDFRNSEPGCRRYLGAGWHALEDTHVWSKDAVSTLVFSVSEQVAASPLGLAITGRFGAGSKLLRVSANGGEEITASAIDEGWISFDIDLCPLSHGGEDFILLFDVGTTFAPPEEVDTRQLGFCLRSICLKEKG